MDKNYKIGKSLILDGTVKNITDLFEYVPKSNVARDINMHFNTLASRIDQPGTFSIDELTGIAELMEIDPMTLITMTYTQYNHERKTKKK